MDANKNNPPLDSYDKIKKVLDLLDKGRTISKKSEYRYVLLPKAQYGIQELLQTSDQELYKYIDFYNGKLFFDALIVNNKIAPGAIKTLEQFHELREHESTMRWYCDIGNDRFDNIIKLIFKFNSVYVDDKKIPIEQINQWKKIFPDNILKEGWIIVSFSQQKTDLSFENIRDVKTFQKRLGFESIENSHEFVDWFKKKFPNQKIDLLDNEEKIKLNGNKTVDFCFLFTRFAPESIIDWNELAEIIDCGDHRVSPENLYIKSRLSRRNDFVKKNGNDFEYCPVNNIEDTENKNQSKPEGVKSKYKPTKTYCLLAVLFFLASIALSIFWTLYCLFCLVFTIYFAIKVLTSYKYNKRFEDSQMEFPANLVEANNKNYIRDNNSSQLVLLKQWESNLDKRIIQK